MSHKLWSGSWQRLAVVDAISDSESDIRHAWGSGLSDVIVYHLTPSHHRLVVETPRH